MLIPTGDHTIKIDAKGRVRIPSKAQEHLLAKDGNCIVINCGYSKYLNIYPKTIWDQKAAEVSALPDYKKDNRIFKRRFFSGKTELVLDGSDRINIPNHLLKYIGIESASEKPELKLTTVGDKMELWLLSEYEKDLAALSQEEYEAVSERVYEGMEKNKRNNES